ncbi:MAG: hypothetical protein AABX99_01910 [Nanoarchaeota archaeon]
MSLISELLAKENVAELEDILKKGKEKNISQLTSFLKENVYPFYLKEINQTFGAVQENQELKDYYFKK